MTISVSITILWFTINVKCINKSEYRKYLLKRYIKNLTRKYFNLNMSPTVSGFNQKKKYKTKIHAFNVLLFYQCLWLFLFHFSGAPFKKKT